MSGQWITGTMNHQLPKMAKMDASNSERGGNEITAVNENVKWPYSRCGSNSSDP